MCDAEDLLESQDVDELAAALPMLRDLAPAVVLEIGSYTGASLRVWATVATADALLIAVDTRPERVKPFARDGQAGVVIGGESQEPDTFAQVVDRLAGRPVDFLFIDGDHHLPMADFRLYSPLVRTGGIIGFHDIAHRGGTFGTVAAWQEIEATYGADAVPFVNADRDESIAMGIGLLRWAGA